MTRKAGVYVLLALFLLGLWGCAIYPNFVEQLRNNGVVVDAWTRGKRAEERGEYEKAKEEYYFVKRFATTYYLQWRAQERYEEVSRKLEEMD
jgi:hypothetical protein